jgi:hypothetical protein
MVIPLITPFYEQGVGGLVQGFLFLDAFLKVT